MTRINRCVQAYKWTTQEVGAVSSHYVLASHFLPLPTFLSAPKTFSSLPSPLFFSVPFFVFLHPMQFPIFCLLTNSFHRRSRILQALKRCCAGGSRVKLIFDFNLESCLISCKRYLLIISCWLDTYGKGIYLNTDLLYLFQIYVYTTQNVTHGQFLVGINLFKFRVSFLVDWFPFWG